MKIVSIYLSLVLLGALFACNKQNFDYPADTVGSSKVVHFPLISINGDKVVAIRQGSSYTDPGATASINGATATYTTSMTITGSTAPGVYTIEYTAKNAENFTSTDFRIVAVVSNAIWTNPDAIANDFSGTYLRGATGETSTWTKIAPGTYEVENPGGAASGEGFLSIVLNSSGNTIKMPAQNSGYYGGTISTSGESYSTGPPASYTWVFNAPGYGTSARTFVKQ
jgi:hypothetical protein